MKTSTGHQLHPGYVPLDRVNVYGRLPLTELLTAVIYVLNFIYLSHFYSKYKLDPQLVFMEMFNIGALCKVWIVAVQYGCIALALMGALSSYPRLLKLPILLQQITGSAQLLFSIYCLCCIWIGRHDWYIFLLCQGALQPFHFIDLGWDIGTQEIHFTLAMILCSFVNLLLAQLLSYFKDNLLTALADSNASRSFPPAYSPVDGSHHTQGSPPGSSLRKSAVDSYFLMRDNSGEQVFVAFIYLVTFFYRSHSYVKNVDPQLAFMEMFNIDAFYSVMIMGVQFSCIALAIMGALASCPRILSVPIIFQSVLGFVQVLFSIYFLSCILIGHRVDWCNILNNKGDCPSSPCADQDWGLTGEALVALIILISAIINFALARMFKSLQKDMQSAPVGSNACLRVDPVTPYYDASV